VEADGTISATGMNNEGQLGNLRRGDQSLVPEPLFGGAAGAVAAVAAGAEHTIYLKEDGTVFAAGIMTGDKYYGQLGMPAGDWDYATGPGQVTALVGTKIVAVAASGGHTVFLDADGRVWAAGLNDDGKLGVGQSDHKIFSPTKLSHRPGTRMAAMADGRFVAIAAGGSGEWGTGHTMCVHEGGGVWAVGNNDRGQLGDASTENRDQAVEVKVLGLYNTKSSLNLGADGKGKVAAGWKHTVRARPGRLSALRVSHSKFVLYAGFVWRAGRLTAKNGGFRLGQVFIHSDGRVWTAGSNEFRQLGAGISDELRNSATPAKGALDHDLDIKPLVVAAAAGEGHTVFLASDGTVYAVGSNTQVLLVCRNDTCARTKLSRTPTFLRTKLTHCGQHRGSWGPGRTCVVMPHRSSTGRTTAARNGRAMTARHRARSGDIALAKLPKCLHRVQPRVVLCVTSCSRTCPCWLMAGGLTSWRLRPGKSTRWPRRRAWA
jgi:alpha-tubulin suppressor-like RCC1 family protein